MMAVVGFDCRELMQVEYPSPVTFAVIAITWRHASRVCAVAELGDRLTGTQLAAMGASSFARCPSCC